MSGDDIRAEAFRRILGALADRCRHNGPWSQELDACRDCHQSAADSVDALGELLPVGEEWRTVHRKSPRVTETVRAYSRDDAHRYASATGGTVERRYLGAWTEAAE